VPLESEVEAFQKFYDPDESFRAFSRRLSELRNEPQSAPRPS